MTHKLVIPALVSLLFATTAAHATPTLIAIGSLSGSISDLSTQTSGALENGVAGNLLGGLGSGLAWAGGSNFYATPDRGPNAVTYNTLVDDTTSYISRFQTINMALTVNPAASTPGQLAYLLNPVLTNTTLLSSATPLNYGTGALGTDATHTLGSGVPALNAINNTNYFTGRSDGYLGTGSGNPTNARLDPESIRVSNDGKSIFVSDEYGPYLYQFDVATGQRIRSFNLPANLAVTNLGTTTGAEGSPANTTGRVANKGMEGLAISPDGKTLVGIMQASLLQDKNKVVRLVKVDIDPASPTYGATKEYAYKLTTGSGVSEILAINDHEFLVDERDGAGLGDGTNAVTKQLFKIDLTGATEVTTLTGSSSDQSALLAASGTVHKSASAYLDLVAALTAYGIPANQIPAKIEGIAFGADVVVDGVAKHTLYVANDNDFVPGVAGDNKFYVFSIDAGDLSSYQAQAITPSAVPLPSALLLMISGLGGFGFLAKRRKA